MQQIRRIHKDKGKNSVRISEELRDRPVSIRQSKTIEKSIQSFRGIEATEQLFNLVKQRIKNKHLNTQNFITNNSRRKESVSREARLKIALLNVEDGLPTLKRVEPSKPLDVDNEDLCEIKEKQVDTNIPWHHPNRSIKTSKIVNLFEDSTLNLISQPSRRSGAFTGVTSIK